MVENVPGRPVSLRRGKEIDARLVGEIARFEIRTTSRGTRIVLVYVLDDCGVLQGPIVLAISEDVEIVESKLVGRVTIETKPPAEGYEHPLGRIVRYDHVPVTSNEEAA